MNSFNSCNSPVLSSGTHRGPWGQKARAQMQTQVCVTPKPVLFAFSYSVYQPPTVCRALTQANSKGKRSLSPVSRQRPNLAVKLQLAHHTQQLSRNGPPSMEERSVTLTWHLGNLCPRGHPAQACCPENASLVLWARSAPVNLPFPLLAEHRSCLPRSSSLRDITFHFSVSPHIWLPLGISHLLKFLLPHCLPALELSVVHCYLL